MRSGLVQLGAWTAATGAAVALSWLGVHAVLAATVFEQPTVAALPSVPSSRTAPPTAPPTGGAPASTTAVAPAPSPDPTPGAGTPSRSGPSTTAAAKKPSPPVGTVQSYLLPGGRVALNLLPTEARLVSATPEVGWTVQTWQEDQWMRVVFSKDGRASQVWVTWNTGRPVVQTDPG
ncbi:hypothetical protein ACIQBJ_30750 [Kitasatospora sp. NPDC088391]|uniref:hypothetical protein n=1 Tax=Kitasatospora sp. NPDC088391 TaxID=3364074 RepID=UPI003816D86A